MSAYDTRRADEEAIRAVIDSLVEAVRRKDVDAMLAHCAPQIAIFDMVPPLRHAGPDAVRRLWTKTLSAFEPPIDYELDQLEIVVSGDVAFTRSLNRFGGSGPGRIHQRTWLCSTLGLRRIDGQWKVVHEHASVPIDMTTGRALLDLKP